MSTYTQQHNHCHRLIHSSFPSPGLERERPSGLPAPFSPHQQYLTAVGQKPSEVYWTGHGQNHLGERNGDNNQKECSKQYQLKCSSQYDTGTHVMSCHVAELCNVVNWSTFTLRDTMCFDTRIDLGSILAYGSCQRLMLNQSDCMIIGCESHMRMGEGGNWHCKRSARWIANSSMRSYTAQCYMTWHETQCRIMN